MLLWLVPGKKYIVMLAVLFLIAMIIGHKTGLVQEHLGVDFGPLVPDLLKRGTDQAGSKLGGIWDWVTQLWSDAKIDDTPTSTTAVTP